MNLIMVFGVYAAIYQEPSSSRYRRTSYFSRHLQS
jgi:hypothetical protein